MVKVLDKANNVEYYMDGILKQNLDVVKPHVLKDWDMCFIFCGVEGGGKSTLAMQVARYLAGERFTLEHVCLSPKQFMEKIKKPNFLQPGDVLILDESFMINSRSTMSELNRQFLAILSECRQKQLFLLLNLPNYFDLDKNLALWRSRGMFYVYADNMQRGYFNFFGYEKKKYLYINGKKFYDYKAGKKDFQGRFTKYMPLDDAGYRELKRVAFEYREEDNPRKSKHLAQRNVLIKWLIDLDKTPTEIAKFLTDKGHDITQQAISLVKVSQAQSPAE